MDDNSPSTSGASSSDDRSTLGRLVQPFTELRTWIGALVGMLCAGFALGAAELIAGIVSTWKSPIIDVGDRVIELAPSFVTKFAIDVFGTNDKPALLIGIGVLTALYAAVLGVLAFRRQVAIGLIGFGVFGLIGFIAVVTKATDPGILSTTPIVVGTALGAAALYGTHQLVTAAVDHETDAVTESSDERELDDDDVVELTGSSRRQVLVRSGGAAAVLAIAGGSTAAAGRALRSRFSATESRTELGLPTPSEALEPAPEGVDVGVEGISQFYTPNDTFYRIDTALSVPQLRTEDYNLNVSGMVDNTLNLSFEELTDRDVVEYDITMTCVSNTIGGDLVGNARWLGVRLDELLEEAGVSPDATQVVGRSSDNYTCGFPVEAAMDGRNAIVAFGMNGEPLPLEHGFPVRLVVPGLYGYISATKWLTQIELTTFEDFQSYWVPRGYADRAPIKMQSRIDSIDGLGTLQRNADGMAAIGGVAWAQTRGVSGVQVQLDDGEWQDCELGVALNDDTWRQWAFRWMPESEGRVSIRTRMIDGNGEVQTEERTDPLPDGASGYHQIIVFVA